MLRIICALFFTTPSLIHHSNNYFTWMRFYLHQIMSLILQHLKTCYTEDITINLGVERMLVLKLNVLYMLKVFLQYEGTGTRWGHVCQSSPGKFRWWMREPSLSNSWWFEHGEGVTCGLLVEYAHLRRMLKEFVFLVNPCI